MKKTIFTLLFIITFLTNYNCYAKISPSFDCGKAKTEVEKIICSDDELSILDKTLSNNYNKLMRRLYSEDKKTLKTMQRAWNKNREKMECMESKDIKTKTKCLKTTYQQRIDDINEWKKDKRQRKGIYSLTKNIPILDEKTCKAFLENLKEFEDEDYLVGDLRISPKFKDWFWKFEWEDMPFNEENLKLYEMMAKTRAKGTKNDPEEDWKEKLEYIKQNKVTLQRSKIRIHNENEELDIIKVSYTFWSKSTTGGFHYILNKDGDGLDPYGADFSVNDKGEGGGGHHMYYYT